MVGRHRDRPLSGARLSTSLPHHLSRDGQSTNLHELAGVHLVYESIGIKEGTPMTEQRFEWIAKNANA